MKNSNDNIRNRNHDLLACRAVRQKGENIVKWIKGQRISWLGHLERMEEDRMPRKIFSQELEGTRRRGRPRKGWKEEVERDLQVLGVRRWTELVADRKKWKDIVRQAKAHSGLQCQWKKKKKQCINQLCYHVPLIIQYSYLKCRNNEVILKCDVKFSPSFGIMVAR